eukprot:EG_transcript_29969
MSSMGMFAVLVLSGAVVAAILFIIFDAIEEIVLVAIFGVMAAVAGAYAMVAVAMLKIINWMLGRKPDKEHPHHQVSRPSPSQRAALRAKQAEEEARLKAAAVVEAAEAPQAPPIAGDGPGLASAGDSLTETRTAGGPAVSLPKVQ